MIYGNGYELMSWEKNEVVIIYRMAIMVGVLCRQETLKADLDGTTFVYNCPMLFLEHTLLAS